MSIIGHSLSVLCILIFASLLSEFVLNAKDVFPYNCDKKIDFIKKGIGKRNLNILELLFYNSIFSESPD